jgi:galactokinase
MKMTWKPDKPTQRKREQRLRLERQQLRKDFAKNMERAEELAHVYSSATDAAAVDTGDLAQQFVAWALARFAYLKSCQPMSEEHKDMDETWREIVVTAEACATASAARTYAKRRAAQKRAADAFRKRKASEGR